MVRGNHQAIDSDARRGVVNHVLSHHSQSDCPLNLSGAARTSPACLLAPVAVELGWMLVANSAGLPIGPEEVLDRYRLAARRAAVDSMHLAGSWGSGDDSRRPESERIIGRFGTLPPRGLDATIGDWDAQVDLAVVIGLLLRGWRKGLDAEADAVLGSGVTARDDLAWWSDRAVEAARRRL